MLTRMTRRALQQAEYAQHDDLREHIRHDTQVDCAFAPIDGVFLDNLACAIDAAEHDGGKGHNEEDFLRITTRTL